MTSYATRVLDGNARQAAPACAAGVALIAALLYVAIRQTGQYEQALTLLGGAVSCALLLYPIFSRPIIGLALLPAASILPPVTIGPLHEASIAFLAGPVLAAAWLLSRVSREGGLRLLRTPVFRPLAALALVVIVASFVGLYDWFGVPGASTVARVAGLGIFLTSISILIVAAHEFRSLRWLKLAVFGLLAVGAAVLVCALLTELGVANVQLVAAEHGVGSMFWTWLMALAFSQGLVNRDLSILSRLACFLIVAGVMAITMGPWRDWASGWAPSCVGLGVTLAVARPRLAALVGIVLAIVLAGNAAAARDMAWTDDQVYSAKTRAAAAQTLLQIARENPVIGFGPANYYHYTPLFPILGWYVRFSSHNNYFDLILQTGLCGLFCVGWLWIELGIASWKARSRARPGFERAYLYGATGGLAGTVVAGALGDWVLPFVYNVGIAGMSSSILAWIFLGGLVAVVSLQGRGRPEALDL